MANEAQSRQWPADKVERWPVSKLRGYPQNPMQHSDAQIEQIMASMREFGWTIPVLVDDKGEIIAGHGRLAAATKLGLAEVPVMVARGWTDEQKRAYRIADNQLPRLSEWSPELLKLELADLKLADYDLKLLGFDDIQLVSFMAGIGTSGDPEAAPEPPAVPVSRAGDLWLLGKHRLLCGDCTVADDVAKALGEVRPHLMVTDPPYGVDYDATWRDSKGEFARRGFEPGPVKMRGVVNNDQRSDWREAWGLCPSDVAYVWHGALHAITVANDLESCGLITRSQIIWAKQHFPMSRGDYHWQHEPCWYAVRKGAHGHWQGDRKQTTLWQIENLNPVGRKGGAGYGIDEKLGHSTQKPVECMKRPIDNNSKPGDSVYDPFVGSGTTIIAAEMTGRACYAIEIDPIYVDVTIERWQNYTTKKQATLEATGQTFEEVGEERKKKSPPKRAPSRRKKASATSGALQNTA